MAVPDRRVAIVTGAASGIGEELSRGLVAKGWKVAGLDLAVQSAAAEELSKELGDAFIFISCDVSNYDELAKAFSKTFEKWGRIDALCSNAGFVDKSSVYLLNRRENTEYVSVCETLGALPDIDALSSTAGAGFSLYRRDVQRSALWHSARGPLHAAKLDARRIYCCNVQYRWHPPDGIVTRIFRSQSCGMQSKANAPPRTVTDYFSRSLGSCGRLLLY